MKVLIACEFSGIARDAFRAKGHDAWSCDLLPTEKPGQHLQMDILELLSGWGSFDGEPDHESREAIKTIQTKKN